MTTHVASGAATTTVQKAAMAVAAAFALVGVLGFVPGITTDYDRMELLGHDSGAQLLGIFGVSVLHIVVHLLFAAVGFALARTWSGARAFLIGGGFVYVALTVYGALVERGSDANFVPLDVEDNWLHLVLGLGMLVLGFVLSRPVADGVVSSSSTGR
jgi:hypothetical protein